MSRKRKVKVIAKTLKQHWYGPPLSKHEYRWLAEHVLDSLKKDKQRRFEEAMSSEDFDDLP